MSTSYYPLRPPFTHLKLEQGPAHCELHVWVNHAKAGVLTVRVEELGGTLGAFFGDQRGDPTLRTWYDGSRGLQVNDYEGAYLPDSALVMSENFELFTAGQVRARKGQKGSAGAES